MLIDSHCHLDYPALAKDRAGVLSRARGAGIARFINISTTKTDFAKVLITAEQEDDVYCSVGAHPHHVADPGDNFTLEELIAQAKHPKVVGIGETGLDYFYEHGPREEQKKSFCTHIRASVSSGVPLIIHTRDAEADTAAILKDEGAAPNSPMRGVLHCFTSKRILAEQAVAFGFYISLSGILTFKKSQELRDTARDVPLDRLLIETDAPFLAPEPYRGKICEPAYVAETARVLADVKGVSIDEIARATTENFFRLFSKVKRP